MIRRLRTTTFRWLYDASTQSSALFSEKRIKHTLTYSTSDLDSKLRVGEHFFLQDRRRFNLREDATATLAKNAKPETFQPPRRRYCDVSEERQTTRVFLLEFHTIRLAAQQPKRRQTYFSTKTPTSVLDRSGILLSKTLLECSRPARLLTVRSGVRSATYTPRLHRCRVQSAP
ncbi:hypothetical protein QE152_g9468 [Popillia japonica]|uniref:Uncharacterized protein n=1 Tax=Popillia japonica TaxID=7064 RepID=A0AAW1LUI1_POPJA